LARSSRASRICVDEPRDALHQLPLLWHFPSLLRWPVLTLLLETRLIRVALSPSVQGSPHIRFLLLFPLRRRRLVFEDRMWEQPQHLHPRPNLPLLRSMISPTISVCLRPLFCRGGRGATPATVATNSRDVRGVRERVRRQDEKVPRARRELGSVKIPTLRWLSAACGQHGAPRSAQRLPQLTGAGRGQNGPETPGILRYRGRFRPRIAAHHTAVWYMDLRPTSTHRIDRLEFSISEWPNGSAWCGYYAWHCSASRRSPCQPPTAAAAPITRRPLHRRRRCRPSRRCAT
jgi:hypothetical protein